MQAGFDRLCMNPPPGTRMMGFGKRDAGSVSDSIHDDIYVRVLYIKDGLEETLIISFDMCFIGREDADRFKGALGRHLDVTPRQILMNATHSHVGPASGWWAYGDYLPPERLYLRDLEAKVIQAARSARAKAIPVNLQAGMGRSQVPMNRLRRMSDGRIENRPNPEGAVCDVLPVLLMKDESDIPVACVFSISAHPSIMEQNNGYINVESTIGAGSSFYVYFPAAQAKEQVTEEEASPVSLPSGKDCVLLVEDDEAVRTFAAQVLIGQGYHVLEAPSGMEALLMVNQQRDRQIDLFVTDIIMPQMSGKALTDVLQSHYPDLKVLFMTGYPPETVAMHGIDDSEIAVLPKPFTQDRMVNLVRDMLDA